MIVKKLVRARVSRGWTIWSAAKRTVSVHPYALRKLESGKTDSTRILAATMVDLINLYYPDLEISDFVGEAVTGYLRAQRVKPVGRPRKEPNYVKPENPHTAG